MVGELVGRGVKGGDGVAVGAVQSAGVDDTFAVDALVASDVGVSVQ